MEQLLCNIEANPRIESIHTLGRALPKAYAYADDINTIIKDNGAGDTEVFREYERLSNLSGLELNADKTEILQFGNSIKRDFEVEYLRKRYRITSSEKIKINGVIFHSRYEATVEANVQSVVSKMEAQLKKWSRRNLSILAKILIVKTFAISQAVYIMQSLKLDKNHFKLMNQILYKFIWNRHFLAAKAPERVKREIINTPIKLGGFGMLDVEELDASLKLRSLGRLQLTKHPFVNIIKDATNLSCFFNPKIETKIDPFSVKAVELLREDRTKMWANVKMLGDRGFISAVRELEISKVMNSRGLLSLAYFTQRRRGRTKIKDLNPAELEDLRRHIEASKLNGLRTAVRLRIPPPDEDLIRSYFIKDRHRTLESVTSKEFRTQRAEKSPLADYKIGLRLSPQEALTWGLKISKLTSTQHKSILLRVAHGDIYTKEKLHRFGLIDSDRCPRCNEIETLQHKFITCQYVNKILRVLKTLTGTTTVDQTHLAMGTFINSDQAYLTLAAEIIQRITRLKDDQDYLLHPKHFVNLAIRSLAIKEGNKSLKDLFCALQE